MEPAAVVVFVAGRHMKPGRNHGDLLVFPPLEGLLPRGTRGLVGAVLSTLLCRLLGIITTGTLASRLLRRGAILAIAVAVAAVAATTALPPTATFWSLSLQAPGQNDPLPLLLGSGLKLGPVPGVEDVPGTLRLVLGDT